MTPQWNGIEQRLELLKGCLLKLEPLKIKTSDEFASDPYLKDIVERNLEVAAQACIDISNRIILHGTCQEITEGQNLFRLKMRLFRKMADHVSSASCWILR